ncbi:PREDICTED: probable tRNA pseudouridine synthase 2-like [Lipotes vexillifer]|uniref:Probable tRNA pseudouridine synthase 2-like n=1 Tax=Lipotes vexillifer TaxID=118797 RepID=A0A340WKK0_LIPVE|nr:PREDICTED: probable tRNA pseudouridine synthase 2-like [Lipotes vexillifer]
MGLAGLAWLHRLFAAYKPPGLKWKQLRDTVELQLLKGLSAGKRPASEHRVRFLLGPMEGSEEKLTLTATSVSTLIDHPQVRGPTFTSLKIGMGHRLDAQAPGVLVLGVGRGRRLLTDMYNAHLTKDYTVHGLLGKATDDFCEDGQLVEKTTTASAALARHKQAQIFEEHAAQVHVRNTVLSQGSSSSFSSSPESEGKTLEPPSDSLLPCQFEKKRKGNMLNISDNISERQSDSWFPVPRFNRAAAATCLTHEGHPEATGSSRLERQAIGLRQGPSL